MRLAFLCSALGRPARFVRGCFFFNDTPTTEIYTAWYTLSLHDALPISECEFPPSILTRSGWSPPPRCRPSPRSEEHTSELQSHHTSSYAVFCLKKKKKTNTKSTNRIPEIMLVPKTQPRTR